jgi:valyl-tRNA synthetase
MPFVTEELWAETGRTGPAREKLLALSGWPALEGLCDAGADAELGWLIEQITGIRSVKQEMNVPPGARLNLEVVGASPATLARIERQRGALGRVARIEAVIAATEVPKRAAQIVIGEATYALPLGGVIDLDAEAARLTRDAAKCEAEIAQVDKKLGNPQFVAKAPEEVIEEQRTRRSDAVERRERLLRALARLQ